MGHHRQITVNQKIAASQARRTRVKPKIDKD
jgi:hypothetical protein